MNTAFVVCVIAVAGIVASCGAAPATSSDPVAGSNVDTRVLVKLVRPSSDSAAIAAAASAAAELPVRYLAATSPQWHALALHCGSADQCDAALQRLRADTTTFAAVERDERKRSAKP